MTCIAILFHRISQDSSTGTLSFEVAEEGDAGVYVCIVSTQLNDIRGPSVSSTPTTVTIIGKGYIPSVIIRICNKGIICNKFKH